MKDKKYYVYEHIRMDNMTCFYVGMGSGNRAYKIKRNQHHDFIVKKYGMLVVIIKEGLTLEEAKQLEEKIIYEYVFELGYGIDILGFDKDKDEVGHLTNATWGGEGTKGLKGKYHPRYGVKLSVEEKKRLSEIASKRTGKLNSNFNNHKLAGKNHFNYGKHHSEETKLKISNRNKGKFSGEKNPMYGKRFFGRDNPNFGNKWSEEQKEKASKYWKKHSHFSINNPNKRSVICITTGEIFETITEAMEKYNIKGSSDIGKVCKGISKTCGKTETGLRLKWMYYDDFIQQNKPSTTIEK